MQNPVPGPPVAAVVPVALPAEAAHAHTDANGAPVQLQARLRMLARVVIVLSVLTLLSSGWIVGPILSIVFAALTIRSTNKAPNLTHLRIFRGLSICKVILSVFAVLGALIAGGAVVSCACSDTCVSESFATYTHMREMAANGTLRVGMHAPPPPPPHVPLPSPPMVTEHGSESEASEEEQALPLKPRTLSHTHTHMRAALAQVREHPRPATPPVDLAGGKGIVPVPAPESEASSAPQRPGHGWAAHALTHMLEHAGVRWALPGRAHGCHAHRGEMAARWHAHMNGTSHGKRVSAWRMWSWLLAHADELEARAEAEAQDVDETDAELSDVISETETAVDGSMPPAEPAVDVVPAVEGPRLRALLGRHEGRHEERHKEDVMREEHRKRRQVDHEDEADKDDGRDNVMGQSMLWGMLTDGRHGDVDQATFERGAMRTCASGPLVLILILTLLAADIALHVYVAKVTSAYARHPWTIAADEQRRRERALARSGFMPPQVAAIANAGAAPAAPLPDASATYRFVPGQGFVQEAPAVARSPVREWLHSMFPQRRGAYVRVDGAEAATAVELPAAVNPYSQVSAAPTASVAPTAYVPAGGLPANPAAYATAVPTAAVMPPPTVPSHYTYAVMPSQHARF